MAGSETLAWFVLSRRVFVLAPRLRSIFFLGSPSVVSVASQHVRQGHRIHESIAGDGARPARCRPGGQGGSARFRPPEGFFLCRSPCQTDICGSSLGFLLCESMNMNGVVY